MYVIYIKRAPLLMEVLMWHWNALSLDHVIFLISTLGGEFVHNSIFVLFYDG